MSPSSDRGRCGNAAPRRRMCRARVLAWTNLNRARSRDAAALPRARSAKPRRYGQAMPVRPKCFSPEAATKPTLTQGIAPASDAARPVEADPEALMLPPPLRQRQPKHREVRIDTICNAGPNRAILVASVNGSNHSRSDRAEADANVRPDHSPNSGSRLSKPIRESGFPPSAVTRIVSSRPTPPPPGTPGAQIRGSTARGKSTRASSRRSPYVGVRAAGRKKRLDPRRPGTTPGSRWCSDRDARRSPRGPHPRSRSRSCHRRCRPPPTGNAI